MHNYTFAFLILHYNEPDITIQCVNSIRENTIGFAVHIVIVDNCSPDGSGSKLADIYKEEDAITILLSDKNLGFANGNNFGYCYIKNTIHADFICIMNNDVLLMQNDFIPRIYKEYQTSECGIIGPHITLLNGSTNYMYLKIHTKKYFEEELQNSKKMYKYYTSKLYPVRNIINSILRKIEQSKTGQSKVEEKKAEQIAMILASKQRHQNIVLHGCCLILTPKYINHFNDAFNNKTFMFREEELLYLRCRQNNILTIYEPSIDILHLEDVSTNSVYKKDNKREAFKCKCQIDSLKVLLSELQ